jgi:hypothetical protein
MMPMRRARPGRGTDATSAWAAALALLARSIGAIKNGEQVVGNMTRVKVVKN